MRRLRPGQSPDLDQEGLYSIGAAITVEQESHAGKGEVYDAGDNVVVAWEKQSQEDGDPISHFWWAIGHYHEPTLSHEAVFSFTFPAEQQKTPETVKTVELLNQLVAQSEFALPKIT